jgi:hypothetical protein
MVNVEPDVGAVLKHFAAEGKPERSVNRHDIWMNKGE